MSTVTELELFAAGEGEPAPAFPAGQPDADPTAVLADLQDQVGSVFERMKWAEDEIAAAARRHPEQADKLWHAFSLLTPTGPLMEHELVYRAYARELLERVAADADTRPATAVEVAVALHDISRVTPLTSAAIGLYLRMWQQAGMPDPGGEFATVLGHHEALEGGRIDDHERYARAKLADPARRLGDIECDGRHHGEPVACRYAEAGS